MPRIRTSTGAEHQIKINFSRGFDTEYGKVSAYNRVGNSC